MTTHYTTTQWNDKKTIVGGTGIDPARPINLLIGFHGADSTPENLLIHGNKLKLENAILAFPEGPVETGKGLWSWWRDGPRQKETVAAFVDYARQTIDAARRYAQTTAPGHAIHTSLWGFSQGGAAALVYALLGSHALHKVASVCGFLPEIHDTPANGGKPARILGIFGGNDDVIPPFLAEFALEEMKNRGHDLLARKTPQGHEINAENLRDIAEFLNS
jgi:predicted esterase